MNLKFLVFFNRDYRITIGKGEEEDGGKGGICEGKERCRPGIRKDRNLNGDVAVMVRVSKKLYMPPPTIVGRQHYVFGSHVRPSVR